jgi:hypothetical protein
MVELFPLGFKRRFLPDRMEEAYVTASVNEYKGIGTKI